MDEEWNRVYRCLEVLFSKGTRVEIEYTNDRTVCRYGDAISVASRVPTLNRTGR